GDEAIPVEGADGGVARGAGARLRVWRRDLHRLRRLRLRGGGYDRLSPEGLLASARTRAGSGRGGADPPALALCEGGRGGRVEPSRDDDGAPAHVPARETVHPAFAGLPPETEGQLRAGVSGGNGEPRRVPRSGVVRRARSGGRRPARRREPARRLPPPLLRAAAAWGRIALAHHPRAGISRRAS